MNSKNAVSRLAAVARVDSITSTQADFLATHVPLNKLILPGQFSIKPAITKPQTEEQVFQNIIANPNNKHQFIVVYGQSGTGKSHLIRWLEARFEQKKPDNEVVLFVRRSDNTLKGTIRQLVAKPEVKDLANREVFERLVRATTTIDETKLKDMIYHNFIIEVDHDDGSHERTLMNIKRKRLAAFLNNEIIHAHMMRVDGPVERIFSKVAESTSIVDRDIVAQFLPEDFEVTADLYDTVMRAGADSKAEKLAKELMADEDGVDLCRELAEYMNQFVNTVVQRCAGIEPGDFRDVFNEIRRELYRLGKNLTLFIEDVTSFTGVDDALLDALIIDHSGMDEGDPLCRISSVVGTTGGYLQNNFRDNHKDRITSFIFIPDDAFDEEGVFEFVARYLNVMSLPEASVNEWLTEHRAEAEYYPVHIASEGSNWDSVTIAYGKSLCLYPFTRSSIRYLYAHALTNGHQTPRYIIRDIIEPIVKDVLDDPSNFPGDYCSLVGYDHSLPELIGNQVTDKNEQRRLLRFLTIWGNGKPEVSTAAQGKTVSGIPEVLFGDFNLPMIQFSRVVEAKKPEQQQRGQEAESNDTTTPQNDIPKEKIERYEQAYRLLQRWEAGEPIDFSVTTGVVGTLRDALKSLNSYAFSSINWLDWGIPADHIDRIKKGKAELIGLERQTRGECLYALSATWESVYLICAIIRYNEYGKGSWDYPDAYADVYRLTSWTERVKSALVKVIRYRDGREVSYIDAAIIAEVYRLILSGEYGEKSMKNLTIRDLLEEKKAKNTAGHQDRWVSLLRLIREKDAAQQNRKLIRQYFDIPQGDGGKNIVLNALEFTQVLSRIKRARLTLSEQEIHMLESDPIKPRREVYEYMKRITDRLDGVAQQEKQMGEQLYDRICTDIDCDELEEEDIQDFVALVENFYTEANKTQFNVFRPAILDEVKKNAARIVQAIEVVANVADEQDCLTVLMAYSGEQNPILILSQLCGLLDKLSTDLEKVQKELLIRREKVSDVTTELSGMTMFEAQLHSLDEDINILEGRE